MITPISVLVVDDHPVVLTGLVALVSSDPAFTIAATARSVTEAAGLDLDPPPGVAVLDLQLPDGDGITLGVSLKQRWPGVRVLILTMDAQESTIIRSLAQGLDGYLLKDADPDDVLAALHAAASGALVVGRGAASAIAAAAAAAPPSLADPRGDLLAPLDPRDLEILELLMQGLGTAQVAARLYLAPKTIRNRVSDIVGKLGVATREDAVDVARAAGLGRNGGGMP